MLYHQQTLILLLLMGKAWLIELNENFLDTMYGSRFYEQMFQLSGNKIDSIKWLTFKGLDDLKLLNLSRNYLNAIDNHTFFGLVNLEILDISRNKLSHIARDGLFSLMSLEFLDLRGNQLKYLASDSWLGDNPDLSNLAELDLSMNMIEQIAADALKGLVQLQKLKLDQNQIQLIRPQSFDGLTQLDVLDLGNNSIKSLFLPTLNRLCIKEFYFANNPLYKYLQFSSEQNCVRISYLDNFTANISELNVSLSTTSVLKCDYNFLFTFLGFFYLNNYRN